MKKQLSIITSAVILSSTAAYADSNTIEDAFKNGKVSGDVSVHYQKTSNKNSADAGFTAGSIGLNYKTDSINGFSAEAGFRANHEFSEEETGNFEGEFENDSVMNVANISYENEMLSITAGRQEIDLEWIGDYNEAIVAAITPIENLTIVAAYSTRQAAIGVDENKKFADVTKEGAFVLDVKYEAIEGLVLNPYYYSAEDVANFYGLKTDYDTDMFGLTAHYATSSEKAAAAKDGSIAHFEARTSIVGLDLAAGYATTDKDAGVASINAFGDNIDPTEELGDYVYAADTDTFYGSAAYTIADVELSALYAEAENATKTDKEITIGAAYAFNDNLSAEILYSDLSLESATDFNKVAATVSYAF